MYLRHNRWKTASRLGVIFAITIAMNAMILSDTFARGGRGDSGREYFLRRGGPTEALDVENIAFHKPLAERGFALQVLHQLRELRFTLFRHAKG